MANSIINRRITRRMGSQNMKRALNRISKEMIELIRLAPERGPNYDRESKILQYEVIQLAKRIVEYWK